MLSVPASDALALKTSIPRAQGGSFAPAFPQNLFALTLIMDLALNGNSTNSTTPPYLDTPLFWPGQASVINWWILFLCIWCVLIVRPRRHLLIIVRFDRYDFATSSTLLVSAAAGRRSWSFSRALRNLEYYEEYVIASRKLVSLRRDEGLGGVCTDLCNLDCVCMVGHCVRLLTKSCI